MKIRPKDISPKHAGMICTFSYVTCSYGFTGHSQAKGLEGESVDTSHIILGRICEVTEKEILFYDCFYSRHTHDLSFSLGPLYNRCNHDEPYIVERKNMNPKTWIILNKEECSNSVAQHLRSDRSTIWNIRIDLLEDLPEL